MSEVHRHEKPRMLAGHGFARWRQLRPFWAGVFLVLGGVLTGWWTLAPFSRTFSTGLGDNSSTLLMVVLVAGGVVVWVAPQRRRVVGVLGMAIGVLSIVTAHLGGLIAALTTLVGGAMALSWVAPRSLGHLAPDVRELAASGGTTVLPEPVAAAPAGERPVFPAAAKAEPAVVSPSPAPAAVPAPAPVAVHAPVVVPPPVVVPSVVAAAPRPTPVPRVPVAAVPLEPVPQSTPQSTPQPTAVPEPTPSRAPLADPDATLLPPPVAMPLLLPPPVPVEVKWPGSED